MQWKNNKNVKKQQSLATVYTQYTIPKIYVESGLDENNASYSHPWARNVYLKVYLPDLTKYSKLTVGRGVLGSGTCHACGVYKNNDLIVNIPISNESQEFNISSISGSGYDIVLGAYDLRIANSYIYLENVTLSN